MISTKAKHKSPYDPASPLLCFYPTEKSVHVQSRTEKRMFIVVKTGNCPKLEATQTSISKRMDKYIVVYSNYTAIDEQTTTCNNMDEAKDVC